MLGEGVCLVIFDEVDGTNIFDWLFFISPLDSSELVGLLSWSFIFEDWFGLEDVLAGLVSDGLVASAVVVNLMPEFIIKLLNILLNGVDLSPNSVRTVQRVLLAATRLRSLQTNPDQLLDRLDLLVFGYSCEVGGELRQLTDNFLHFYI